MLGERGCSQRSVERRLGWGAGYLSQLLRPGCSPELKARHLLAILDAVGIPPGAFFGRLYDLAPRPAAAGSADRPAGAEREAPIDLDEIERRIVAAVQRELDRRQAEEAERARGGAENDGTTDTGRRRATAKTGRGRTRRKRKRKGRGRAAR
jgi:transcriptional regulator with XRE-family HTH domain